MLVPANTQVMTATQRRRGRRRRVHHRRDLVIAPPELFAAKSSTARRRRPDRRRLGGPALRHRRRALLPRPTTLTPGDAFYLGFREQPRGHGAPAAGRGTRRGHRRRPAQPTADLGGLERRGLAADHASPRGHHRRAQPPRRGRAAGTRRARAADGGQRVGVLAASAAARAAAPGSRRTRRRPGCAASRWRRSAAPSPPSTPRPSAARCSAAATARPARRSRSTGSRCCHAATARRSGSSTASEDDEWKEVEDFSASGPSDRHFVWDSGTGVIRFGPRDPVPRRVGAPARRDPAGRRRGRGHRLPPRRWRARQRRRPHAHRCCARAVPFVTGVVNLAAASGGVDAETVAEAKMRGPLTLRTGQRAVTARDFERLTLESSIEVARARCLPARRGSGTVQLLVVPQVRTDPTTHQLDDFAISPATDGDPHREPRRAPPGRHRRRGEHAVLPGCFRRGARARRPGTPRRAGPAAGHGRPRPLPQPTRRRSGRDRVAVRRRREPGRRHPAARVRGRRGPGRRGAALRVRPAHRSSARVGQGRDPARSRIRCSCPADHQVVVR